MKLTISILEDQPTEAEYLESLLHKWSSQENCELEIAEYCSGEEFFAQNNTDTYKRFSVFFLEVNSNPRIPFVTQDSLFVNENPVL